MQSVIDDADFIRKRIAQLEAEKKALRFAECDCQMVIDPSTGDANKIHQAACPHRLGADGMGTYWPASERLSDGSRPDPRDVWGRVLPWLVRS